MIFRFLKWTIIPLPTEKPCLAVIFTEILNTCVSGIDRPFGGGPSHPISQQILQVQTGTVNADAGKVFH